MNESEILFQISNIVNGPLSFPQAVEQISQLLERVQPLNSFDQPPRSLYSVDLRDGRETLATLRFASHQFPQRLADFIGEQLGMLLARTRLAERCAQLRREIEKIEEDLANRKVMQRAEGILIAKRGMALPVARRWIALQSQKTGLRKRDIADRIIAYDQATGLREQRIA